MYVSLCVCMCVYISVRVYVFAYIHVYVPVVPFSVFTFACIYMNVYTETRVQSQVDKKWYSKPPYLILSIIRYVSGVKWSNLEKGVAPT